MKDGKQSPDLHDASLEARQIVVTRVIHAPREQVFDAFTDRNDIDTWWGPDGFTNTTHSMDVRPGGAWIYTMRGPDGTEYPNAIVYREVDRPRRLAFDHGATVEKADFHSVITFTEQGGRTRVEMRSTFPTAAARDFVVREHHAIEGGRQTLARLAAHVENPHGAGRRDEAAEAGTATVTVDRLLDASPEKVWNALTEADRLMQWWAPDGSTVSHCTIDVRVGGVFHFCMRSPAGEETWGRGVFRRIVPGRRLEYVDTFSDREGHVTIRDGFTEETYVVLELVPEDGGTRIRVEHSGLGQDQGEGDGWRQMLGRLDALLGRGNGGRAEPAP